MSARRAADAALLLVLLGLLVRRLDGPDAVTAVGLLLAVVALAVGDDVVGARRARQLARRTAAWLGSARLEPLAAVGGGPWQELAVSLNALASSYERRGEALARERPWRLELVDALTQPALLFSAEGRLQAANDAARQLAGIPADAAQLTVVQALGSSALAEAVRRARESLQPLTIDVERGPQDLRATVSLVGDETLVVIVDRTRERRVEDLRRNFVVNASHELKTPVTAIQTLAEALEVTLREDPTRALPLVRRLTGESERLARLVSELLDLRRLEERGPLERVLIDLAEVVRRVVAAELPRAEARGIALEVDAPESARLAGVRADVEAIVTNLVANAITYNRDGGRVSVRVVTADGTRVMTVADTGIGIAQHDRDRIFERFYRVDSARSRATGGTGLGLAIVRHAAERHGGSVRVDSLLGEGTTFTVVRPIDSPA